jgi:hypothetical protein
MRWEVHWRLRAKECRLLAAHFEAMAQEYERLATEKPPAPEPMERPTRDIQEAPDLLQSTGPASGWGDCWC